MWIVPSTNIKSSATNIFISNLKPTQASCRQCGRYFNQIAAQTENQTLCSKYDSLEGSAIPKIACECDLTSIDALTLLPKRDALFGSCLYLFLNSYQTISANFQPFAVQVHFNMDEAATGSVTNTNEQQSTPAGIIGFHLSFTQV